jgi:hypothetical protein
VWNSSVGSALANSPFPDENGNIIIRTFFRFAVIEYRLRVDEIRVFYDISGTTVEILAIVAKSGAYSWLAEFADPE